MATNKLKSFYHSSDLYKSFKDLDISVLLHKHIFVSAAAFARLQLSFIAGNANNALQQGNLSMALQHYSAALNTCDMHYPFLQEDVPFILNSRSIVHSRMGNYCPALLDAQQIIDHNPFWHEVIIVRV